MKMQRMKLQRMAGDRDDTELSEGEWRDIATVYARVKPASGREAEQGGGMRSHNSMAIECRYGRVIADATPSDRLIWGDRVLGIESVTNRREGNKWIDITAVRRDG